MERLSGTALTGNAARVSVAAAPLATAKAAVNAAH
jgi:hypothetical protein